MRAAPGRDRQRPMSEPARRVICIGEATVELARGGDGRFALASAGDTFNTAIYLARARVPVAFASALGGDPYSDAIVALAAAEGIGTDLILRAAVRASATRLQFGSSNKSRAGAASRQVCV